MLKNPTLAGLLAALSLNVATGDVVINELSAVDPGRLLRWNADDQPYAGSGPAWWAPEFDDSTWSTGTAPIGFSLGSISTNLSAQLNNVSPSFYTRKTFNASSSEATSARPLQLKINYNDGFIAWINGIEVARGNMGAAKSHIYHDQLAHRSNGSSTTTQTFSLGTASSLLANGDNVLAIQINNQTLAGNMRLDMELVIDQSGGADTQLIDLGSSLRYLPGLREPSSDLVEPAAFDNGVSDWIELHNNGAAAVNLTGWMLSDDNAAPGKWTFPAGTSIPAGGYLLVLADDPDAPITGATYLHANFKLGAGGEFLGLFDDSATAIDIIAPEYPKQHAYHSYGRVDGATMGYFPTPTPGAANSTTALVGKTDAPNFDIPGGFFDGSVTVTLTSQTPGASIRYTTDGTEPTLSNGTDYTAPLNLTQVTNRKGHVIRARAFLAGRIDSNVKTNTYLIGQDARLRTSPSMVISGDPNRSLYDPFGIFAINGGSYPNNQWQPTGIADYNNVINRGRAYERPAHAEFYFTDGTAGFRTDLGIRAAASSYSRPRMLLNQTGSSPWPASPTQKPSINFYFRDEYGNPSVKLPLNGPDRPVDTYERFRLRAGKNDIRNPFIIDELVRRLSRDMGQGASIGTINSLYVNGELKGFYNTCERLREPLFRSLHSTDPNAQWDVLQYEGNDNIAEGDKVAWDDMIDRLDAAETLANWESVLEVADVENMADYYLLNIYMATWDWPHNNWVAAKERSAEGRYRLYVWDAEGAMNNRGNRPISQEMINSFIANGTGELRDLWRGLNRWEEFRILFADRINKHLFNGGVLDERDYDNSHLKSVLDQLVGEFSDLLSIMNGETVQVSKPAAWANPNSGRRRYLFGPTREEFRSNDLWPTAGPPQFSQFGGSVPEGFSLKITNTSGDIYYTTDGTDPRLPGGAANPSATSQPGSVLDVSIVSLGSVWRYNDTGGDLGASWREAGYDDTNWPSGPAPLGYGNIRDSSTATTYPIATNINSTQPRQPTTYLRGSFELDDASSFLSLDMKIRSDAGAVIYLNNVEAFRDSNIPLGATYADSATSDASDNNEGDLDEYALDPALLVDGTNVIAIELRNVSVNSSDLVIDIQLDAQRTNPDNAPLPIDGTTTVMARTLENGVWSALTAADFTVATVPADASNLAIAEMLYNPAGPTTEEIAAGFTDGDQFEFLRVQNIGTSAIDLHDVRFTGGIGFDFITSDVRALPTGGVALIVSDLDAFRARFGTGFDSIIAGTYSGKLNNGGESLRLIGTGDAVIRDFAYDVDAPWPDLSNADGHSIQIIDPSAAHGDGANWRASASVGGTPGGALTFAAWLPSQFTPAQLAAPSVSDPGADPDGDGLANFVEFALGSPPLSADNDLPAPSTEVTRLGAVDFLTITYTRQPGARAVQVTAEISNDLVTWSAGGTAIPPDTVNPDGTITTIFAHPMPVVPATGRYIRLSFAE